MKKILNVSVIAVLAILPMAANAAVTDADPGQTNADAPVATNPPKYSLAAAHTTDDTHMATAGYVKGAYNAAIKAINKVSSTALTADGTATLTNKTIDANGTGNSITNIETDNFNADAIVTSTEAIKLDGTGSDTALPTEKAVAGAITTATNGMVTETGTQTLTNKTISGGTVSGATITGGTIDASSTDISNLSASDFATGVVVSSTTGIAATTDAASDDKLVTEKAIKAALTTATTGQVTLDGTQTLTNKTIDADDNTISDLELDNFKSGVVTTSVAAVASASDTKVATEKAVASAIADFATKTGVTNTISNSTISGTVPVLTVWNDPTSATTVGINASITGAAYTETPPTQAP